MVTALKYIIRSTTLLNIRIICHCHWYPANSSVAGQSQASSLIYYWVKRWLGRESKSRCHNDNKVPFLFFIVPLKLSKTNSLKFIIFCSLFFFSFCLFWVKLCNFLTSWSSANPCLAVVKAGTQSNGTWKLRITSSFSQCLVSELINLIKRRGPKEKKKGPVQEQLTAWEMFSSSHIGFSRLITSCMLTLMLSS